MLVLLTLASFAFAQDESLSGSDGFTNGGAVKRSADSATAEDKLSNIFQCSSGLIKETTNFNSQIYDQIYTQVETLYNSLSVACSEESCPRMDLAGCFVRLAAHDFLDFNVTEATFHNDDTKIAGGSDGCIRMNEGDNKGLSECTSQSQLPAIYNNFCSQVSIPDFLVIVSETLLSLTATCPKSMKQAFKYNFRYGRSWCGASGYTKQGKDFEISSMNAMGAYGWGDIFGTHASIEHQPNKLWERKVSGSLFYLDGATNTTWERNTDSQAIACNKTGEEIGLQFDDMTLGTALLGAHGIGRAEVKNSGYRGFWSDPYDASVFNNGFFKNLLYNGFEPHQSRQETGTKGESDFEEGRFDWIRSDSLKEGTHHELMLNTDIVLTHNYEITAKNSQCCAFFDTAFLEQAGLGADKSKFCSENGTCCEKYTVNCNDLELQKKTLEYTMLGKSIKPNADGNIIKNTVPRDQRTKEFITASVNGIGRDSVIAFAKDEGKWLHYFHKSWYLATTAGGLTLKRMESSEQVHGGEYVNTECFSWGCEQFTGGFPKVPSDVYFNAHGTDWRRDYFNTCAYKYQEQQCTADEIQTPEKIRANAGANASFQNDTDEIQTPDTDAGMKITTDADAANRAKNQGTNHVPEIFNGEKSSSITIKIALIPLFFL